MIHRKKTYRVGDRITGAINAITFDGKGVIRTQDNFVVFVPYTSRNDEVECEIYLLKKNYAEAKLIHVIKPSAFRTQPLCPYFGQCGGCQLQHISYQEQMAIKEQAIRDSLRKFAHLEAIALKIHPAQQQWGYRRHVYLTLLPAREGFKMGYIANDHSFLEVDQCPIFISPDDAIIQELKIAVAKMSSTNGGGKLMIVKNPDGGFLLHFHFEKWSASNLSFIKSYQANSSHWKQVMISSPTKSVRLGKTTLQTSVIGLTISYTSSSFMQNHPEESAKIYATLAEMANQLKPQRILDLYCGIGISSLALSPFADKIIGIEDNGIAIKMANENARNNSKKNIQFIREKVERILDDVLTKEKWDMVIVNPPREGLDQSVVQGLIQHKPRDLIYISCMPATLARDVKCFQEGGFQVQECQAFDMFPQTSHVETLVHLKNFRPSKD
ncbi:MAG: class I SAM-dependent RNA methyltransferase [Parachlamydiaceae bacterium]